MAQPGSSLHPREELLARLNADQQQKLEQLAGLLGDGLQTLVQRHQAGRLVAAFLKPRAGQKVMTEHELAAVVGHRASALGKWRRFAKDLSEADARCWDAKGLAFASIIHSDPAPEPKKRRAFIEEGLEAGWTSDRYRAEAQRRWPKRLGKGGRGGLDKKGRRPWKPLMNPGLLASIAWSC